MTSNKQRFSEKIENKLFLYKNCIKDNKLKTFFDESILNKKTCSFCNKKNQKCLDIYEQSSFYNLISAIIRYHYSEDTYNKHWGGDSIFQIFTKENHILNTLNMHQNKYFEYAIEALTMRIEDNYGVSIFWGNYEDGTRGCYFDSIKDSRSPQISKLESILLKENYFLHEEEIQSILTSYNDSIVSTLDENSTFYRARIGYEKKVLVDEGLFRGKKYRYIPFKGKKISSPDSYLVNGGRLNRAGVSFLYLATNKETAINEVRPDPGHIVSMGKFKSLKPLTIIDFDKIFVNLSQDKESLKSFTFLNHIDQLFSHPITQDERHLYIITQFFADIFRKIGFDAIKFTSSVGSGQNLLVFNPSNFTYMKSKENRTYKIDNIRYSIHPLKN